MLPGLAVNWPFLLLRAIAAALFGVVVLLWPAPPLQSLVLLFAAYAVVDGVVALILALSVKGLPGFGSLLFDALVRIGVAAPALAALALNDVVAAWAVPERTGGDCRRHRDSPRAERRVAAPPSRAQRRYCVACS